MAKFTEEQYQEFKGLVEMTSSRDQMDRINARVNMPKFIEKHTKALCDEMYKRLCKED